MVEIIFDCNPKKELIEYFALLLHLHTKNYLKKYKLPEPPKINKIILRKFRLLLNKELGYYKPLCYLLFNKGLNKKEREKLINLLEEYEEIEKNYHKLLGRLNSFKGKLEKLKPEIKKLVTYAEDYTKMKFVSGKKIIVIPIPYTDGASSLPFKKNFYICFGAYQKADIKKDRILYLILHETLHLLNLLPQSSKIAKKLNKKYKKHTIYGEFSNVINESFTHAIELRIIKKRTKKLPKDASECFKFGKTKLFYDLLKKEYEKKGKYKNIKYFGLRVIREFLL